MRHLHVLAVLLIACQAPAPEPEVRAPARPASAVSVGAALEGRLEQQLAALAGAYGAQRWDEHAALTAGAIELLARFDADTLAEIQGPLVIRLHQHGGPYLGVALELAHRLARAPTAERRRALAALREAVKAPTWQGDSLVVIGDRTLDRPRLVPEKAGWTALRLQVSAVGERLAATGAGPEAMLRLPALLHACARGHGARGTPAHERCERLARLVEDALGGEDQASLRVKELEQGVQVLPEALPCRLPVAAGWVRRVDEGGACREPRWMELLREPLLGPEVTLPELPPAKAFEVAGATLPPAPVAIHARSTPEGLRLRAFRDARASGLHARQVWTIEPDGQVSRSLVVESRGVTTRYDGDGRVLEVSWPGGAVRVAPGAAGSDDLAPCEPGWEMGPAPSRLANLVIPGEDDPLVSEALRACVAQRSASLQPCEGVALCARGDLDPTTCACTRPAPAGGGSFCKLARCDGAWCDPVTASCRTEEPGPEPHLGVPSVARLAVPDPGGVTASRPPLTGTPAEIRAALAAGSR